MPLELYQQHLRDRIYDAWHQPGVTNVCATMATGLGKSYTVGHIVHDLNAPTVVIAHRTELVGQLSMSLAERGIRHALTAPNASIKAIAQEHIRKLKRSFYDDRAHVRVAGVQSLINLTDTEAPWLQSARYWVTDECFIGDTLVETDNGSRRIADIKVDDMVLSYDESTDSFVYQPVLDVWVNAAPRHLAKIVIEDAVTTCTLGHPYYTAEGWKDAGNLKSGDNILQCSMHELRNNDTDSSDPSVLSVSENWSSVLQTVLRIRASRRSAKLAETKIRRNQVSLVRSSGNTNRRATYRFQKTRSSLLLSRMFSSLRRFGVVENCISNKSQICVSTYADEQSDAQSGISSAHVRIIAQNRSRPIGSRWQRERLDRRGEHPGGEPFRAWLRSKLHSQNEDASRVGFPAMLQDRHRKLGAKDWSRSRWEQSRVASPSGREKRCVSRWARVENIEIFKSRDIKLSGECGFDDRVYNLHVANTNTYVANGAVVHNCHHVLRTNIWGRALARMPHARGLGVTATPIRAEGSGLGRHADGVFDTLVEGPQLGEGIDLGFLTPYRLVCPKNDIEVDDSLISDTTGDFNQVRLRDIVHKSATLIGNVVETYRKFAADKAAIVFVVDIEEAGRMAAAFKAKGVAAEAISSKTPPELRAKIMRDFRDRRVLVLCNVDLFGEGVDIPALETVIMARPTASLGLFLQQAGRALRLNVSPELRAQWPGLTPEQRKAHIAASPKPLALIIDHVGNVMRHRPPCTVRTWSLDRRERKSRSAPADAIPLTTCLNELCLQPYERHLTECPYCGKSPPPPADRAGPKEVDGDMVLLDPKTLRLLEVNLARVDGTPTVPYGASPIVAMAVRKNHHDRQLAQRDLRQVIALWAGVYAARGEEDRVIHKRFFLTFNTTIIEAMTLGATDAAALMSRVIGEMK